MQRPNEGISKVFNIGELLVAVVNQKHACEDPQQQQAQISNDRLRKDGADHGPFVVYMNLRSFVELARLN